MTKSSEFLYTYKVSQFKNTSNYIRSLKLPPAFTDVKTDYFFPESLQYTEGYRESTCENPE